MIIETKYRQLVIRVQAPQEKKKRDIKTLCERFCPYIKTVNCPFYKWIVVFINCVHIQPEMKTLNGFWPFLAHFLHLYLFIRVLKKITHTKFKINSDSINNVYLIYDIYMIYAFFFV